MTWAQMGFDALPLAPAGDALRHLCHALEERINVYNRHQGYYDTQIYDDDYDRMIPPGAIINRILFRMRPDSQDPGYREWLWDKKFPASPYQYQVLSTDNWGNGTAWCTATIADYYARMNALAGFDISQDVNPLAPVTSAMVNGLKNAINSIHCEIDINAPPYVYHHREFEYSYDEELGQWVEYDYPWEEDSPGPEAPPYLGNYVVKHTSTWQGEVYTWYEGGENWMLEGDGFLWDAAGRTELSCKAILVKIRSNTYSFAPLSSYAAGQYYVWPAPVGSARINPCAGYSPMRPGTPPTEGDYFLLAEPSQMAVVDYGGMLDYYDPPEE